MSDIVRDDPRATRATRRAVRHTSRDGGAVQVTTTDGVWDLHFARALSHDLHRRLTPQTAHVILDVRGVSAGPEAAELMVLLGLRRAMRQRGGRLTVVAEGERYERLARMSALDDLITVVPSLAAALG